MTDPEWTEASAELVAHAIHVADCEWDWDDCRKDGAHHQAVDAVLAALADAGLLVPVGADVREDLGYKSEDTGDVTLVGWSSSPPDVRRTVITTPWIEVQS